MFGEAFCHDVEPVDEFGGGIFGFLKALDPMQSLVKKKGGGPAAAPAEKSPYGDVPSGYVPAPPAGYEYAPAYQAAGTGGGGTPWLLIGIGGVVLLGGAAWFFLRKKRKK